MESILDKSVPQHPPKYTTISSKVKYLLISWNPTEIKHQKIKSLVHFLYVDMSRIFYLLLNNLTLSYFHSIEYKDFLFSPFSFYSLKLFFLTSKQRKLETTTILSPVTASCYNIKTSPANVFIHYLLLSTSSLPSHISSGIKKMILHLKWSRFLPDWSKSIQNESRFFTRYKHGIIHTPNLWSSILFFSKFCLPIWFDC